LRMTSLMAIGDAIIAQLYHAAKLRLLTLQTDA